MRRRTALAVALPVTALGAVVAVVIASGSGADGRDGATTGSHGATQLVTRRTLVERAQLDGTLGYGDERPALDRLEGTLTWLPATGAVIRPGRRLFAVDGKPVILMDGSVPAWRGLASGVPDGADVRQLERNLAAFGYDPGAVDDHFDAATAAAVSRWQGAVGLTRSGRVELGRVVFLPGPRRIAKVDASLGGTGSGAANASYDGGGELRTLAVSTGAATTPTTPGDTTAPTTPTTPSTTPTTPSTAPATTVATPPMAPSARPGTRSPTTPRTTPTAPSTTPTTPGATGTPAATGTPGATGMPSSDGNGDGGDRDGSGQDGDGGAGAGSAASKILSTTSTARVVTAELGASDQSVARVGRRAIVTLPDGRRVGGRIVHVGTVATSADDGADDPGGGAPGDSGDPTVPLTIRLRSTRAAGRLDAAPVSVELARTTRRNVLAVPIAALVGRPGGGYAVRVARRSGAVADVPVEPGLFADGYVELSGGAVDAGDRVEVPR